MFLVFGVSNKQYIPLIVFLYGGIYISIVFFRLCIPLLVGQNFSRFWLAFSGSTFFHTVNSFIMVTFVYRLLKDSFNDNLVPSPASGFPANLFFERTRFLHYITCKKKFDDLFTTNRHYELR